MNPRHPLRSMACAGTRTYHAVVAGLSKLLPIGLASAAAGLWAVSAAAQDPGFFSETLEAAGRIQSPTEVQVGSRDCFVNPTEESLFGFTNLTGQGVLTYYDEIPASKLYVEIGGANHVS